LILNNDIAAAFSFNHKNGTNGNGHKLTPQQELDRMISEARAAWRESAQCRLRRQVRHLHSRVATIRELAEVLYGPELSAQTREDLEFLAVASTGLKATISAIGERAR
jgi:hypothetical protein